MATYSCSWFVLRLWSTSMEPMMLVVLFAVARKKTGVQCRMPRLVMLSRGRSCEVVDVLLEICAVNWRFRSDEWVAHQFHHLLMLLRSMSYKIL